MGPIIAHLREFFLADHVLSKLFVTFDFLLFLESTYIYILLIGSPMSKMICLIVGLSVSHFYICLSVCLSVYLSIWSSTTINKASPNLMHWLSGELRGDVVPLRVRCRGSTATTICQTLDVAKMLLSFLLQLLVRSRLAFEHRLSGGRGFGRGAGGRGRSVGVLNGSWFVGGGSEARIVKKWIFETAS